MSLSLTTEVSDMLSVSDPNNYHNIPLLSTIYLKFLHRSRQKIPVIISGKLEQVKTFTYSHYSTGTQVLSIVIDGKTYDFSDDSIRHMSLFSITEKSDSTAFVPITNDAQNTAMCVGGKCVVRSLSGNVIEVEALKKGDKILLENGYYETVKCLVCSYAYFLFCFGSLSITPCHPIKWNGDWTFPINHEFEEGIYSITSHEPMAVYSILLEKSNGLGIMINDIPVAPLGHGVMEGVLAHQLFSNHDTISNALASADFNGFENGFVTIKSLIRDEDTGRIKGFK